MSLNPRRTAAGDVVTVPGSTANLGGGFDTLGLALQLYLRVRILDVRDDGEARLEVATSVPAVRGRNAVAHGYEAMAQRLGGGAPTVLVEVNSEIPMAAGLGSSAAATVAGIRVFERVTDRPIDTRLMLGVAAALEGHADNAAPALHGGLTSVVDRAAADPVVLQWTWPEALRVVVATPATGLSTVRARAALAAEVPRQDAVFNLQRVLLLVHALQSGNLGQVREAVRDRWHQPARSSLVPHLEAVLSLDDPDVVGAFLSGAGPSVAVLASRNLSRVEGLLKTTCERAGVPVTVRTLAVHQLSDVLPSLAASVPGRSA